MKFSIKTLIPFWISFVFTPFLNSPASAGIYDALCENLDCKIVLAGKGVTGPQGFIPAHRVVQWYTGGGEEHNRAAQAVGVGGGSVGGAIVGGIATCWTIVLCGPGIIAGGAAGGVGGSNLGKSADYYFTIVGYNQEGKKTIQSFNFINKKPVGKIMQELPLVTGLAMGELRTMEEIKRGDKRAASSGSGRDQLPQRIDALNKPNRTTISLPDSL